ncbi:hypothetical protein [Mesonia aquimarina]|uniref:hypothetical protein n=1 Tax=Mesonia aquimarina TaxID=1504967 RepID=UPI000EF61B8A|nr:hypothetical protein [Mesonia aquimarina]
MKKLKLGLLAFIVTGFVACSSDDDGTSNPDPQPSTSNYFPLKTGNSWTYNNFRDLQDNSTIENEETLSVENSSEENDTKIFDLSTTQPDAGGYIGFATEVFSKANISKNQENLIADGNISFEVQGLPSFEIPIENAVVYSKYENSGTELYTSTGSFTETLQGINTDINYTITTQQEDSFDEFEAGDTTYNDVISSSVSLVAEVIIQNPFGGPFTILESQEVLKSTNYYAKDVGLIYSNTNFSYQLDLSGIPLPIEIPESNTIIETQTLLSYNVDLEE